MRDQDPRALLGLSPDATRDEAQRAFRRRAKETHPDAGGDAAAFRAVAAAWAELAPQLSTGRRVAALSPHLRAYQARPSRVVWAEPRPRPSASANVDFATILQAELARTAA